MTTQAQDQMTPDQLQWVVDHNLQIRAGHRVQIYKAVEAWRKDKAVLSRLLDEQARWRGVLIRIADHPCECAEWGAWSCAACLAADALAGATERHAEGGGPTP